MKLVRNAIPLACVACAAALVACNKNDRTGETTTRSASEQDRNTAMQAGSTGSSMGSTPSTGTPGSSSDRNNQDMAREQTLRSGAMGEGTGGGAMGGGTGDIASGTDVTGGGMQTTPVRYEMAMARIVGGHCDREVVCNQVGPNKRFASRDVCAREHGQRVQDEIKRTDCANDIDTNKLQACLTSVAQQDCSRLNASLQNVDACKSATLCR
jgi:hypothetical protein